MCARTQTDSRPTLTLISLPLLCLLLGASLALAGGHLDEERVLRHPAHAAAWLVAVGAILPLAAYIAWREPDWGLMYLAAGDQVGVGLRVALVVAGPLCAALGCVLTLGARRGTPLRGYAVLGLSAVAWIGTQIWGWERVSRVGSFGTYQAETRNLMPMLLDSRLGALLVLALAAICGVWGFALLTLRRRADTQRG